MTARRRRTVRPPQRRYQVTPRDRETVFAVGRMAQATSDQLRRLFFGDPSTAARRLAKLVAMGLLNVHVCDQSGPNIYTLGDRGLELLAGGDADPTDLHQSRVGRNHDLHLRLLNDVRVEFVLAVRSRPDVSLDSFHADADLRRAAGARPPAYIPDGIVQLTTATGSLALVLEIDTGSEGHTVFAKKVETTVALWRSGQKCWGARPGSWRPVAFVPSAARARGLARAIVDAGGGALWLVTEFGRLLEVGALGPLFASADEIAAAPRSQPLAYRGALAPSGEAAR